VDKPPPCVSDETCTSDQRCDVGTGRCVPRACQPDVYEPDNDIAHAKALTPGKYINLTLCQTAPNLPLDVDYYSFSLARGDQLGINVDADPFAEDDFTTLVQDGTGRTLAYGKLLVSYVAAAPATYYVSISSIDAYQPYDVVFLLTRGTPCDNDSYEPNDQPSQATPLNSATQVDASICPQDVDNFSVPVPAGKGVKASLINYTSANGLLEVCLFDGTTQIGCSDDPGTPSVSAPAAVAGGKTMRILVDAVDSRSANSYTLKVEFQ
jgi:hypothetical protein